MIAIKTVGATLHGDDTNMNSVALGVSEMQSEAYHVGFYRRELVEYMFNSTVAHHAEESFVKCHGEDLVDHDAEESFVKCHGEDLVVDDDA